MPVDSRLGMAKPQSVRYLASPLSSTPRHHSGIFETSSAAESKALDGESAMRDLKAASSQELAKYVAERVEAYKKSYHFGNDMWVLYKEEFHGWEMENFCKAGAEGLIDLRDILFASGVFIKKDDKMITTHLLELLNQQTFETWPAYESWSTYQERLAAKAKSSELIAPQNQQEQKKPEENIQHTTIEQERFEGSTPKNLSRQGLNNTPDPTLNDEATSQYGHESSLLPHRTTPAVAQPEHKLDSEANKFPVHIQPILEEKEKEKGSIEMILATYSPDTHSREIEALVELYTDERKYAGNNDLFDYKFKIFLSLCRMAGMPREGLPSAFSLMLKDRVFEYYISQMSVNSLSIEQICDEIKNEFEGPHHQINLLQEWNTINLPLTVNANSGKTLTECLDTMVCKQRMLQHGLDNELRSERFVYTVLQAYYGLR